MRSPDADALTAKLADRVEIQHPTTPKVVRQHDAPLLRRMLQRRAARLWLRNEVAVAQAKAGTFTSYKDARRLADAEFRRVEKGR